MRLGMFCTTAVSHLMGIRTVRCGPTRLYRHLVAPAEWLSTMQSKTSLTRSRLIRTSRRTGAGAENAYRNLQTQAQIRHREPDDALRHLGSRSRRHGPPAPPPMKPWRRLGGA
jgi:hypothetical protein